MTNKMHNELVFEVTEEADGGSVVECLNERMVTQGDTREELRVNVKDAVESYLLTARSRKRFGSVSLVTKCS